MWHRFTGIAWMAFGSFFSRFSISDGESWLK